ncbi:MAG: transglycosylase domain-containing protein [Candidatus Saccharimonadales bacterium]
MTASKPRGRQRARKSAAQSKPKTKSGNSLKLNRSLSDRRRAKRDLKSQRRATRLATLPKSPVKRLLYRLHPKRLAGYWFSREGVIMALKLGGVAIVVIFILLIGAFAYFRKDLPQLKNISGANLGGSISYYDRTGKTLLWQDYKAVKRIPVKSNKIANNMKHATVAVEDKNFYHEGAFSLSSYFRAALHDVFGSGNVQGASTITEQVVKLNENLIGSRTISTKVKELILAVDLEREYSKKDILNGYLNVAPYGGVEYGVQAAAQDYFHTTAAKLSLAQSAMLASMPQAPSIYSPYSSEFSKQKLLGRQHYVLDLMAKQGYITKAQANAAKKVNVLAEVHQLKPKYSGIKAPYFVLAAKDELNQKFGSKTVDRGGWKVTTTLNMKIQKAAETDIQNNLPNVKAYGGDEEAIVSEQVKTGQIVAEVGGVDFSNPNYGQINYAHSAKIPPGSSFKPYDYSIFINDHNNVGSGSVLYDVQQPLPGYPCTNKAEPLHGGNCLEDYDFRFPGAETLRYALAGSRNVPAVKTMLTTGVNKTIQTADSMMNAPNAYQCYSDAKLTKTTQCYGSAAIGDGAYLHLDQHVNGDATLARLGNSIPNTYILGIKNSIGKTIYKWKQPKGKQVIRKDAAYILNNMLDDPRATYLPGSCSATNCTPLSAGGYKFQHYKGWDLAVKTGTTNDNFDGLMTSWNTQYATVSWVGYHTRNVALRAGGMEYLTEPLTRNLAEQELNMVGGKPVNWQQPADIKTLPAYVQRSHVGLGSEEPGPSKDLYPAWYVSPKTNNTAATIDKVSGYLATSCTPPLAKQTAYNANSNAFSVDIFYPPNQSHNANATAPSQTDNVHNCSDSPPTLNISSPANCDSATKTCNFTVAVSQGTHPLAGGSYTASPAGTLSLIVNGKTVATTNMSAGSPFNHTFNGIKVKNGDSVSAQAVGSVLYTGGSSNVKVTGLKSAPPPSKNSTITLNPAMSVKGQATFSWSGGSPNYQVINQDGTQVCQTNSMSCSGTAQKGDTITAQDDNGDPSNTITVS